MFFFCFCFFFFFLGGGGCLAFWCFLEVFCWVFGFILLLFFFFFLGGGGGRVARSLGMRLVRAKRHTVTGRHIALGWT